MRRIKADTAELDSQEAFVNIKEKYGHPWPFFHRADLHTGLRELLVASEGVRGEAPAIRLASTVVDIDCEEGIIGLASGLTVRKDLLVIADGAHVSKTPVETDKFGRC